MPITTKYYYDLSYSDVVDGFPFAKLAGPASVLAPGGGISLIVGCDYPGHPGTEITIQVFSPLGIDAATANGSVSDVSTVSADGDGDFTFLQLGVTKHLWDATIRVVSSITTNGVYWLVLQLGNEIGGEPIIPVFEGTPPPPAKPGTPNAELDDPDDPWGPCTITWNTTDDIADITGFVIDRYNSIDPGFASRRGVVFADAANHPNYTFTDWIGSEEWSADVTYTVTAYKLDTPDNTMGEESDPSPEVNFDPGGGEPPPEPDLEIPDPEEEPGPPPDPDPEEEDIVPGTLTGTGYGGINFGGAVSDDIIFSSNPSGIYTLVEGKTHDTLYERLTGVTSVDVKIPDPFIKTGFI